MAAITDNNQYLVELYNQINALWDLNPAYVKPNKVLAIDIDGKYHIVAEDNKTITTLLTTLDNGNTIIHKIPTFKCVEVTLPGSVPGYECTGKLSVTSCTSIEQGNSEPIEIFANSVVMPIFSQYLPLLPMIQ